MVSLKYKGHIVKQISLKFIFVFILNAIKTKHVLYIQKWCDLIIFVTTYNNVTSFVIMQLMDQRCYRQHTNLAICSV